MHYKKELALLKTHVPRLYNEVKHQVKTVSFKEGGDIVTTTDLFIEKHLIEEINKVFPKDTFLSEEFHKDGVLQNRVWIIDPIDGTSNYAVDLDLFVVQIALYDNDDLALSFIYYPAVDKTYYAIKGEGAFINGSKYTANDNKKPSNQMLSMVGITNNKTDKKIYWKLLEYSMNNQYKLRMLGSIGLELAIASEGIFTIFYTNVKNLWDLAPGVLLARESGALLFNEKGETYRITDEHLFVVRNDEFRKIVFELL